MKHYLVIVVSLTVIANSNCGLIDGLLGTVKDTTSSITHHVGGALHYSKNLVFGGTEQNAAGQVVNKPGIVGTISMKIHDASETVREEVRTVLHIFDGDQAHGKGIIGRLLDRVKCRYFKIKNFIFNNGDTQIENRPYFPNKQLKNDTTVLRDKLRKYFKNDASANSGIGQTLNSLQEAINRARQNITRKRQESANENTEQDLSGLIDIRISDNNIAGDLRNDFENGVDAGYDKINDAIDDGRQTLQSSLSNAQRDTNNFIENQRRNIQNQYDQFGDSANKFRSDVSSSISDNIDSQRRNIQNNYNQIANNADRFRSGADQYINENIENQRRNIQNNYNQIANNADRFRSGADQYINDNIENQRSNVQNSYNQLDNNADRLRSGLDQSINDIESQRRNLQNNND